MPELKVGDRVLLSRTVGARRQGTEAVLVEIEKDNHPWPFRLSFPGDETEIYSRDEIELNESLAMSEAEADMYDLVNHPPHYTAHPSGIECIQITEHMGFTLGNAVKYLWRADLKHDTIEDLKKAVWYIEREISRRTS